MHFQKETKYILFICEQRSAVHTHVQIVSSVAILLMVPRRYLRQIWVFSTDIILGIHISSSI